MLAHNSHKAPSETQSFFVSIIEPFNTPVRSSKAQLARHCNSGRKWCKHQRRELGNHSTQLEHYTTSLNSASSTQVWSAAHDLQPVFAEIDRLVANNLRKVQKAFRDHKVGPHHFQGSTGYGHGDWGRETLDSVSHHHSTHCTRF